MNLGTFLSFIKSLITKKDLVEDYNNSIHPANWYTSSEGEAAYKNAKTFSDKYAFYADYLYATAHNGMKTDKGKPILTRMAYVMANCLDGSDLPCGKYPDILDENKNPIVKLITDKGFNPELFKSKDSPHSSGWIDLFYNFFPEKNNGTKYEADYDKGMFNDVESYENAESASFKLQQQIIWMLEPVFNVKYMVGPYSYLCSFDFKIAFEEDIENEREQ